MLKPTLVWSFGEDSQKSKTNETIQYGIYGFDKGWSLFKMVVFINMVYGNI